MQQGAIRARPIAWRDGPPCGEQPAAPRSGDGRPLAQVATRPRGGDRAHLPPRDDRDLAAPLFPDVTITAMRTAIGKACRGAGVPLWSPHDLRHRRISLLHLQGVPWARIAEFVGQRSLKVTADTYTHVLMDERELDYAALAGGRHA